MPPEKTFPQHIQYPTGWVKEIVNSVIAMDFIDPGQSATRIENMTVMNNHLAPVTVELIHHDGTAGRVVWSETMDAGSAVDVMQSRIVQRNKQFFILDVGQKYQVRTTTAVAGAIVWEASGGAYDINAHVASPVYASHAQQHPIDSPADHTGGALTDLKMLKWDTTTGKVVSSGYSDADIAAIGGPSHVQGTDQGLDTGGPNAVVVADVKDAVTKRHSNALDHAKQHDVDDVTSHSAGSMGALQVIAQWDGTKFSPTANTPAELASAVSLKHSNALDHAAGSDPGEAAAIAASHARSHLLTSASDHDLTGITDGKLIKRSGASLADATNTDAEVAAAVATLAATLNISVTDVYFLLEYLITILVRPPYIRQIDGFFAGVNLVNTITTIGTVSNISAGTITTLTQIGGNPAAEPMLITPTRDAWMTEVAPFM